MPKTQVKVTQKQVGKNTRMSFGKINEVLPMPNLIEVQKNSYNWFLTEGLREVFRDVDAITDFNDNFRLTFDDFSIDEKPKYTIAECKERDTTYAAALRVKVSLWKKPVTAEGEAPKDPVKVENEIYMGDMPIMTESGTFVINGAERVIVSQLVRSPGVYYALSAIPRASSSTAPRSFRTAAHGWNTKWIPVTLSMSRSTRTARFRLPCSSAHWHSATKTMLPAFWATA